MPSIFLGYWSQVGQHTAEMRMLRDWELRQKFAMDVKLSLSLQSPPSTLSPSLSLPPSLYSSTRFSAGEFEVEIG